jgi:hypothetical protein
VGGHNLLDDLAQARGYRPLLRTRISHRRPLIQLFSTLLDLGLKLSLSL